MKLRTWVMTQLAAGDLSHPEASLKPNYLEKARETLRDYADAIIRDCGDDPEEEVGLGAGAQVEQSESEEEDGDIVGMFAIQRIDNTDSNSWIYDDAMFTSTIRATEYAETQTARTQIHHRVVYVTLPANWD